jgi:hypothetical protein
MGWHSHFVPIRDIPLEEEHGQNGSPLRDLPLELDAVGTLSGHGFHPLKAQLTLSHFGKPWLNDTFMLSASASPQSADLSSS